MTSSAGVSCRARDQPASGLQRPLRSALSSYRSFRPLAARRHIAPAGSIRWVLAGCLLGAGIGLAAGAGSTKAAVLILLLPALFALLLRPDWLPLLLTITIFCEEVSVGGYTVSRLAGPLAILVLILRLALGGSKASFPRKEIFYAVGAYSVWALASALWSVSLGSSFEQGGTAYALAALTLSIAYMLAMATIVDSVESLRRVVVTIWAMSVIVGVIGISQFHGAEPRAVGLSGDPNFFAALQVICLPIGAVLATQARSTGARRVVLVGLAVTVGSIFTSVSRGGLIGLAAVLLLLMLQPARTFFRTRARKSAFVAVAITGAAVLLVVSFSALSARTESLSSSGSSGSGRSYLWSAAVVAFDEHPTLGLGFGAFASQSNTLLRRTPGVNFRQYKLRPEGQPVHNTYLESFTELGVLGGLLFIGLLAAAALSLQWAAKRALAQQDMFLLALARALQLSLVGFAVTSFFLSAETHRTLWVLLGLSLALTRVLSTRQSPTAKSAGPA